MSVVLVSPHWAANARIQRAANNNPAMRQHETDHAAVTLLQQALILSGFNMAEGADGKFGPHTAGAGVAAQRKFAFATDAGAAGREVFGALDLSLRGWAPPDGAHWGGLLAKTTLPIALRKIRNALQAVVDVRTMLTFGKFDFVTADGVTM